MGFGACRMCVCGPQEAGELLKHQERIRVATKYPRVAKDYFFNKKHQTVEIIKLNGSIELAPIVGLSEVIVDIVETGATLRENGLTVLEEVCPLSARMIVNPVSMSRVQDIYRSSLTFAPEAGTQRMRDVINKGITEEDILNGCASAFGAGWNKVKLYFMNTLPPFLPSTVSISTTR